MKITWTPNPLNTIIELDEHELEVLKLKLKIEAYEEMIFSAHWDLTRTAEYLAGMGSPKTVEEAHAGAIKELDPAYWCDDDNKLDKRIDELLEHYVAELKSPHIGDCTCFAMSCSKCHVEDMLGINTIKGLGKHPGHKVQGAFSNGRNGDVWLPEASLDEAIERLAGYDPKPTSSSGWDKVGGFEAHIPRWKEEAAQAHAWLVSYRDQHFPKE